jgi:GT2 family glycosyltransferase
MVQKVYIVILNYNGWKDTIECLESVLKSNFNNFQIIVVDNDSENNSLEYIKSWALGKISVWLPKDHYFKNLIFPLEKKPIPFLCYEKHELTKHIIMSREEGASGKSSIIFIQAGENNGFAAGNNIGIKYAEIKNDFSHIWLLNNDTVIKDNTLPNLFEFAQSNNIGITGSALYYYDNPRQIQALGGRVNSFFGTTSHNKSVKQLQQRLDDIVVVGASFLISRHCINTIGLLPEEYFLYWEETDYCTNAKKNGLNLGIAIESIVYHKEGATIGSSSKDNNHKSEFADLLSIKNRIYFYKKYFKNSIGLYLSLLITIFNRVKRKQFRRVFKIIKLLY